MIKIATPISHLFEYEEYSRVILDNSDCLECRDRSFNSNLPKQELFHCELQPIHHWHSKELEYIRKIKESKKDLKLITFHIASNCDEPKLNNNIFEVGGRSYTKNEMLKNAEKNFIKIKEICGKNISIAVENNNYYPTVVYKDVTDADFISTVVYDNDIFFLFDIAHAKVTSYNKNINFEKYKNNLPLDKMIQLHICSYAIDNKKNIAYDAHNYPDAEELLEVRKLIKSFDSIKYLTVEYYKDIENLKNSLKKVKSLMIN